MTDIELKLNAWTGNPGTTVFCVQGEQQARTLHVTLIDRTGIQDVMSVAPVTPRYIDLTGYTPRMYVSKPDETGVYFPGTVTDAENGRIDFTLTGQCVAVPGKADCTISLIKEDVELKIVGIVLDIKKSDTDDFIEGSRDEFVELEVLTSQAKEAVSECSAAIGKAEEALEIANTLTQADREAVEEAETQAASARAAASSANTAAQSANTVASAAEAAADRANAAADRLEGIDVGTLANELDAHTGSQVNTDVGVHGIRVNKGNTEYFDGSKWMPTGNGTITNPQNLPNQATLSDISEPGTYYGLAPSDLPTPYNLAPYTLTVFRCGGEDQIGRVAITPFNGAIFTYATPANKWVKLSDYYIESESDSGIWHYIKYSNGIAECWGEAEFTMNLQSGGANIYYANGEAAYPFTFVSRPVVTGSCPWSYTNWVNVFPSISDNKKCEWLYFQTNQNGNNSKRKVYIYVKGRWK